MGAITDSGILYMWGDSSLGCLGKPPSDINKRIFSTVPTQVDYFVDKKVRSIFNHKL